MINNVITLELGKALYKYAMYTEKQIITVVQATPNTQPDGVQGALLSLLYQSDCGPLPISQLPTAKAPKLITKKTIMYL